MAAKKKQIGNGKIYVSASFNNTLVTISDDNGDVISWGSAGFQDLKEREKQLHLQLLQLLMKLLKRPKMNLG